jgi:four helix bundle protein
MALASQCYKTTQTFPKSEIYGLTSQVRRAAASIPANIAEGYGRETTGSYIQSLRIAQGSLKEVETFVLLAHDIGMLDKPALDQILNRCEEVGKLLRALIRALQKKEGV